MVKIKQDGQPHYCFEVEREVEALAIVELKRRGHESCGLIIYSTQGEIRAAIIRDPPRMQEDYLLLHTHGIYKRIWALWKTNIYDATQVWLALAVGNSVTLY